MFSSNQTASGADPDLTTNTHPKKVLIIPYEPQMHISDADQDISEYSERSPQEIRSMIRTGLIENLNKSLSHDCQTHSLLQDLRPESRQEMNNIYAAIDYSLDTSYAILHPRPDSQEAIGRWNEKRARKHELEKRIASGDVKYMNAKILDPDLLPALNQKYGTDEIVLITQVEIKTKAKDCMDFQSHIYQRDYKVHYTVFDKEGKQRYGDVIKVTSPSGSNEIHEIIAKYLPDLGDMIKNTVE